MATRRGQGGVYRRGRTWWITYSIGGQKFRESAGTTVHGDAAKLLTQRLTERGRGISRRDLEKVTFPELAGLITADYAKNARKSTRRLKSSLHHLTAAFSSWRVVDIGEDVIDRYAADRLDSGAAAATVNRELAALRRMLKLGVRAKLVGRMPVIDLLKEDNVRKGFLEEAAFKAIRAELPERLKALADVAYCTGWRKGEILSRRWRHVNMKDGWLRLEPGETKNSKGRQFPFAPIPRLKAALEALYTQRLETEKRTGKVIRAVFFYPETGEPIRDFRGAWEGACKRAGHPGVIFHDFRRTAARNLIRAGVPQTVAMQLTGHLTTSIFQRYAIVDESMLSEAATKLAAHFGGESAQRKVLPISRDSHSSVTVSGHRE